jgi:hypothetical protein
MFVCSCVPSILNMQGYMPHVYTMGMYQTNCEGMCLLKSGCPACNAQHPSPCWLLHHACNRSRGRGSSLHSIVMKPDDGKKQGLCGEGFGDKLARCGWGGRFVRTGGLRVVRWGLGVVRGGLWAVGEPHAHTHKHQHHQTKRKPEYMEIGVCLDRPLEESASMSAAYCLQNPVFI